MPRAYRRKSPVLSKAEIKARRKGGQSTSVKKARAARRNAQLGGRPKGRKNRKKPCQP